jgi:hypothetical protein
MSTLSRAWVMVNGVWVRRTTGGPGNQPPVAAVTANCTGLSCTFSGTGSADPDGTITNYSWAFGDGGTANTGGTASSSHTYSSAGTYTVVLTVTDNLGATDTAARSVTVSTTPPANYPYFGAASNSGVNLVMSKFGTGSAYRHFFSSGDLTLRATRATGMSILHVSYKPDMATVASGSLDSQIVALVNSLHAGDILTFHHEPDNNGWNSTQIASWKAGHNHLYDIKQSTKPSVYVAPVFVGSMFASYTSNTLRNTWATGLRADFMGWDADGVHITTAESNYNRITYLDEIQNCETYMAHPTNSGMNAMTIGEHMTARVNPPDPTGNLRATWFSQQTQLFIDHGAYAVLCWDVNPAGHNTATNFNILPNPSPELTVWKNRVAANPSTPRT